MHIFVYGAFDWKAKNQFFGTSQKACTSWHKLKDKTIYFNKCNKIKKNIFMYDFIKFGKITKRSE